MTNKTKNLTEDKNSVEILGILKELEVLEQMKKKYPKLAKLSEAQTRYVAMSKFISREYGELLQSNQQEFVNLVCERAESIDTVAAENGTFVEVIYCEQWKDIPITKGGTICHPSVMNDIVKQVESQIAILKTQQDHPYTKCAVTVFTPTSMGLFSVSSRLILGIGEQKDLLDHMDNVCKQGKGRNEVYNNLEAALMERKDGYQYTFNIEKIEEKPTYYIIEDLSTWANNSPEKSVLERFNTIDEAIVKFTEYRKNEYDYSDGMAKLTLGVALGTSEIDVVHVRNNTNFIISDFMGSRINTNKQFLADIKTFHNVVGIDMARLWRDENGEQFKEPKEVNVTEVRILQ